MASNDTSNLAIILLIVFIASTLILCSDLPSASKTNSMFIICMLIIVSLLSTFTFNPSDSIDPYMYASGEFLSGNPKVDGCCLYPEQAVCKKYSEDELQSGCCGKGFNGRKVRFHSDDPSDAPTCRKCRRQGEIL